MLVGFFVLNMFVGVVVENFHRCREEQEKEERVRRLAKRAKQMEKKRRSKFRKNFTKTKPKRKSNTYTLSLEMHEPPYYRDYSSARLLVHSVVTSKYFDLAIAAVIGLNVVTMALEFYMMPKVSLKSIGSLVYCYTSPSFYLYEYTKRFLFHVVTICSYKYI